MDILPSELHDEIFSQLHKMSIYQCALVCRRWSHIVRPCLYGSTFFRTQTTFNKFMNTIMANLSLGSLVLCLETSYRINIGFDIRLVNRFFPNLKTMRLPLKYTNETSDDRTTSMNMTMESVLQLDDCEFSQYLIRSSEQERLTDLHIFRAYGQHHPISQLGDLPFLVDIQIRLDNFFLFATDLENLHKSAPSLQNICLTNIMFSSSEEIPSGIIPSPSVVSVEFDFEGLDGPQIFEYIQHKYPSLKDITVKYEDHSNYDSSFADKAALIFEEGWLPLLELRGSQLLSIRDICVKPRTNIFRVLDDCGCQPELLEVYCNKGLIDVNDFLQSRQRDSLLYLYIRDGLHGHIGSLRDTKLEDLSLYFSENDNVGNEEEIIILRDFIKQCPDTLKELSLFCSLVKLGDTDEDVDFQSSIMSVYINTQPGNLGFCYFSEEEGDEAIKKWCPDICAVSISII